MGRPRRPMRSSAPTAFTRWCGKSCLASLTGEFHRTHRLPDNLSRPRFSAEKRSTTAPNRRGEDRHIVLSMTLSWYRSEIYFVTSLSLSPNSRIESWSAKGDVRELRAAFEGFDRQVHRVLAACPDVHKWAIVDRDALARWTGRNVTLLGDACHPMTPYMAQGAAMAIEDAAVLSRCLRCDVDRDGVANAFRRFEATQTRANRARPADVADQHLAEGEDRHGLGLFLRRLDPVPLAA